MLWPEVNFPHGPLYIDHNQRARFHTTPPIDHASEGLAQDVYVANPGPSEHKAPNVTPLSHHVQKWPIHFDSHGLMFSDVYKAHRMQFQDLRLDST